jgi:hypothetical protein
MQLGGTDQMIHSVEYVVRQWECYPSFLVFFFAISWVSVVLGHLSLGLYVCVAANHAGLIIHGMHVQVTRAFS